MNATLTTRTPLTLALVACACARCGAVRPVGAVVTTPSGEYRCWNLGACADRRAENARIAAQLRAEGETAA
jgi:hypothetical protein